MNVKAFQLVCVAAITWSIANSFSLWQGNNHVAAEWALIAAAWAGLAAARR